MARVFLAAGRTLVWDSQHVELELELEIERESDQMRLAKFLLCGYESYLANTQQCGSTEVSFRSSLFFVCP